MIRYCYIVVEGPQDIEFLIRILKLTYSDLQRIKILSELDLFWKPLIPTTFPIDDDLMKRVPVPIFLQNAELSVAIHSANGIDRLSSTIEESLKILSLEILSSKKIFGVGVFLDADDVETPQERFNKLISKLLSSQELSSQGLSPPSILGNVMKGSPRCGIFIAPNNTDSGTLENILLECAEVNYSDLLNLSNKYVSEIDYAQLPGKDLKEFNKPAGKKKAIVSIISSILKPGKALQVSIQDNRWVDEKTIQLDSIKLVKKFLDEVTGFT